MGKRDEEEEKKRKEKKKARFSQQYNSGNEPKSP